MKAMGKVAVLVAGLTTLLVGCSDLFTAPGPKLPKGVQVLEWTAERQSWWAAVEECSGKKRDFRQVKLYVLPNTISFARPEDGSAVVGLYYPHHSIVVASIIEGIGPLERHEYLHAVKRDVGNKHDEDFTVKCKGVVA